MEAITTPSPHHHRTITAPSPHQACEEGLPRWSNEPYFLNACGKAYNAAKEHVKALMFFSNATRRNPHFLDAAMGRLRAMSKINLPAANASKIDGKLTDQYRLIMDAQRVLKRVEAFAYYALCLCALVCIYN